MREFASPHPLAMVPAITLSFWIIKILATTLGETAGDSITMSWLGETTPQAGMGWFSTRVSRAALFWAAFILTRPLGATLGDFFDKPVGKGGLDVSRPLASAILLAAMALCLWVFPQKASRVSHLEQQA